MHFGDPSAAETGAFYSSVKTQGDALFRKARYKDALTAYDEVPFLCCPSYGSPICSYINCFNSINIEIDCTYLNPFYTQSSSQHFMLHNA